MLNRFTAFFVCLLVAQGAVAQPAPSANGAVDASPGYGALADMLEDDQVRTSLIDELRRLAGEVEIAAPPAEDISLSREIARFTHGFAEQAVAEIGEAYDRVVNFDSVAVTAEGVVDLTQAAFDLAFVIVVVVAVMWAARLPASWVYRRASDWVLASRERPWLRRSVAAISCSMLDLIIVAVGWVVGYLAALFVVGEGGLMDTRQSLFLNAFLVIEAIKVVIRLFFATRYDGLRLLPVRGEDAAYWNTWLSRLTTFAGYGILVIVPIVAFNLGPAAGNIVSIFVHGVALIFVIIVVRQNRRPVREKLKAAAVRARIGFAKMLLGTLARIWHILVIAYFAVLVLLLLIHPETAISFIVAATLQTILAVAGGMLLSTVVDKAIALGIHLKPEVREQFPLLEERLNAFVPTTLKVVRIVIALVVIALVLDAWQIFDLFAWIGSDRGLRFVGTATTIAFIIAAAFILWLLVSSWIEQRLSPGPGGRTAASSARERTLLTLFRNAFTITLVVMAALITLSEIGLDIGPLLAGAGVLGLAIGFGSQKLVQDVITGIFIQLENAIYTGDVVTAAGITGVVEKLTVRSVGLRDLSGTYHLIPFSSVDTVSNFMRGFGFHVGDYRVAYGENIDAVIEVLKEGFEELRTHSPNAASVMDDLEIHGVAELSESHVVVRVRIKALPGMQWAIGREYNAIVKRRFEEAGIEIPFPHVKLYFGANGEGLPAPVDGLRRGGDRKPGRTSHDSEVAQAGTAEPDSERS